MTPAGGVHLADLLEDLKRIAERQRAYASLREGGTKGQKELTVLLDLLASMRASGDEHYFNPGLSPEDPPDCIARTAAGQLVAVEVTELVSQEAIEYNERTRRELGRRPDITEMVMHRWTREDLLRHIDTILIRKESRVYEGGPYAEVVVVIHTDEPLLVRERCEEWLTNYRFGPFGTITTGYLLYPYQPPSGYPYRRLFGAA